VLQFEVELGRISYFYPENIVLGFSDLETYLNIQGNQ